MTLILMLVINTGENVLSDTQQGYEMSSRFKASQFIKKMLYHHSKDVIALYPKPALSSLMPFNVFLSQVIPVSALNEGCEMLHLV